MGKAKKRTSDTRVSSADQPKASALPTLSQKSLTREAVLGSEIFIARSVLCLKECHQFIDFAESLGFQHQGSRGAAHQEALRDNDRISFHDEHLAQQLWNRTGLSTLFGGIDLEGGRAIGLNPHIRFYRYTKGQRFGRHIDESITVGEAQTRYTLLIYLSGGRTLPSSNRNTSSMEQQPLVGGETVFYGRKNRRIASISPEAGMALLHIHGDRCHEHEGAQVKSGCKYILRSDVLFSQ